jgi:hypothetical protein
VVIDAAVRGVTVRAGSFGPIPPFRACETLRRTGASPRRK